jgi:hypothetical protein
MHYMHGADIGSEGDRCAAGITATAPAVLARSGRAWLLDARRLTGICLALLCLCFVIGAESASAYTTSVDGVSDQSLPNWDSGFSDSYFASFFESKWVPGPHIQYARYVVQWNAMTERNESKGNYRERFEAWLADAGSMGLTIDVALTSYNGTYPNSKVEYKEHLIEILKEAEAVSHPIRYLEAWNEPNDQGSETAVRAAEFTNAAYVGCEEAPSKCTIIAGNVQDGPGVKAYEKEYREHLNPVPSIWGVHPYYSVEYMTESYYNEFLESLPNKGTGDQIWFTEIAARQCTPSKNNEESGQAKRAAWLVNTLIHNQKPEHVFYYEFLLKEHKKPSCAETDDALYVPSSDPNAEDSPRAAASYIFGNTGVPAAYTGRVSNVATPNATLTGSVYPGGENTAKYHFEYGTSTSYGSYSSEGSAGSSYGSAPASANVSSLAPGTTYHYRLVAWNVNGSNGLSYGADRTFHTQSPPTVSIGMASSVREEQATLSGTVNPNELDTHYYFQYGTSTLYGSNMPAPPGNDLGNGTSTLPVDVTGSPLEPGTLYHYRLAATSSAGTVYSNDATLTTLNVEASPRWAVRNPITGDLWVYYVNSKSEIAEWAWDTASWGGGAIGGSVAPGTTPSVVHDQTAGDTWVYYVNSKSEIAEWAWDTATWGGGAIGGSVKSGTSPSALHDSTTGDTWVYYVNSKSEIAEWAWDTATWGGGAIGGSVAAGTSPTVVRNPTTGDTWVYYVNSKNEIAEWNWNGSAWHGGAIGGSVAAGTSPSVVHDPATGDTWVYYVNSKNEIAEWAWDTASWGGGAIGGSVKTGTSPSVVRDPVLGDTWVYYMNNKSEMAEWNWNGSAWHGGVL